ncbi:MAG: hypothetical protein AAF546_00255 [Verrucomicrobiota bacterium]
MKKLINISIIAALIALFAGCASTVEQTNIYTACAVAQGATVAIIEDSGELDTAYRISEIANLIIGQTTADTAINDDLDTALNLSDLKAFAERAIPWEEIASTPGRELLARNAFNVIYDQIEMRIDQDVLKTTDVTTIRKIVSCVDDAAMAYIMRGENAFGITPDSFGVSPIVTGYGAAGLEISDDPSMAMNIDDATLWGEIVAFILWLLPIGE